MVSECVQKQIEDKNQHSPMSFYAPGLCWFYNGLFFRIFCQLELSFWLSQALLLIQVQLLAHHHFGNDIIDDCKNGGQDHSGRQFIAHIGTHAGFIHEIG